MNRRNLYLTILVVFIALVAFARWDLVEQAAQMTVKQFGKGGSSRAKIIFEIFLFVGILGLTARSIPTRLDPKRDAVFVLLGSIAGWCAEAWGTRLYLWKYYTSEAPPLWIVPAWPLGLLVIDRMSDHASKFLKERGTPTAFTAVYWLLTVLTAGVFIYFSQPVLGHPSTWALTAALAAAFIIKPNPRKAVPILLTGFVCVFFADLWGTTNNCWRYYIQHPNVPFGLWIGVLFGMTFDTAVVFLCWRLGNSIIEIPKAWGPKGLEDA